MKSVDKGTWKKIVKTVFVWKLISRIFFSLFHLSDHCVSKVNVCSWSEAFQILTSTVREVILQKIWRPAFRTQVRKFTKDQIITFLFYFFTKVFLFWKVLLLLPFSSNNLCVKLLFAFQSLRKIQCYLNIFEKGLFRFESLYLCIIQVSNDTSG